MVAAAMGTGVGEERGGRDDGFCGVDTDREGGGLDGTDKEMMDGEVPSCSAPVVGGAVEIHGVGVGREVIVEFKVGVVELEAVSMRVGRRKLRKGKHF